MCPADTNERLDWVQQFAVHRALRKYRAIFRSKKKDCRVRPKVHEKVRQSWEEPVQ